MPVVQVQLTRQVQPTAGESEKVLLQTAVQVSDRLRRDSRLAAVAVGNTLPFGDGYIGMPLQRTDIPGTQRNSTMMRVDAHYFNAMGIQLSAGRLFSDFDDQSAPNVVILSETLAKNLFPDENPLEKQIQAGRLRLSVIGVVHDIKFGSLKDPPSEIFYRPIAQTSATSAQMGTAKIHLRTRLRRRDAESLVRQAIVDEHAPVRITDTVMLDQEIGDSYFNDTVRMQATAGLTGIALLLIAAGIYGLMAYWVTQRTREIGVRMAIGSTPARIMNLVLKQSLRLVVIGLMIGGPVAVVLTRYLATMIFGAPPTDYAAVIAAGTILTLTVTAAAAIPARRAARLDPLEALRVD